jgi:hypothetical protein
MNINPKSAIIAETCEKNLYNVATRPEAAGGSRASAP